MINQIWLDRNSLVRTYRTNTDSGNGFLYSEIYQCLTRDSGFLKIAQDQCISIEKSMLDRTPLNLYGNTSHDDYLALAVRCLRLHDTLTARAIFFTAILNLFYMKNCPADLAGKTLKEKVKELWRPMLFQFPAWWLVMAAAAFPFMKFLIRNLLALSLLLQKLNLTNASGLQLQWLALFAIMKMGNEKPMKAFLTKLKSQGTSMRKIMLDQKYYETGHPIPDAYEEFTDRILNLH